MSTRQGGPPAVVALGGGHGLAASLSALRRVTPRLTAIVTVADDGGSSGRLRQEFGLLPPGDLRMALAALAGDDEWSGTWARLLQHRFPGDGPLGGHAAGNLVLAALTEVLGSPVPALDAVARLLGADGRVLPVSCEPLDIVAEVAGLDPTDRAALRQVRGQVAVATTSGRVVNVRLVPERPRACPEAVDAVLAADWVVLGPGSLFTSVLPHLLVPELRDALAATRARTLLVLNLAPQPGETAGFSPQDHLAVLAGQVPELPIDVVLADTAALTTATGVLDSRGLIAVAEDLGATVLIAPVAVPGLPQHDPRLLAEQLRGLLAG